MARLVCPLCRTEVVAAGEPEPGACPGCGALVRGGGDDPLSGVALALVQLGADGELAPPVADALFRLSPDDPRSSETTVASDEREGFYRWWVFVRADDDASAIERLVDLTRS